MVAKWFNSLDTNSTKNLSNFVSPPQKLDNRCYHNVHNRRESRVDSDCVLAFGHQIAGENSPTELASWVAFMLRWRNMKSRIWGEQVQPTVLQVHKIGQLLVLPMIVFSWWLSCSPDQTTNYKSKEFTNFWNFRIR